MNKQTMHPATPRGLRTNGTLTGLDVGKHTAKLAVIRRQNQGVTVTRASSISIPTAAQEDVIALSKILCTWLRENSDPNCRDYVGSVPSSMVDYESVAIPLTEPTDFEDLAEETVTALLGHDRRLASHDYWKSTGNATSSTLNLAWTSSDFASELSTRLARDGWRCMALEIPAQTLARISSLGKNTPNRGLVIDIGAGEVSMAFADRANSEYFRNRIRFSPHSATETLAEALGIGNDAAQDLLVYWGVGEASLLQSSQLEALIAQHLTQWLKQLVYEIRRTLNFIKHRFGGLSEGELLLCGGGANIRGLPELLTSELSTPVRIAEPPEGWSWKTAERYSPIFAQAVSLAMYGAAP